MNGCRPAEYPPYPEGRSYSTAPDPVPAVLSRPTGSGGHSAGQALVETMLVLPILLLLLIGFMEVSFLTYARSTYHDAAATLADGLAFGEYTYPSPEFDAIAADELARVGCDREALDVTMDTTGRVIVDLRCSYAAIAYHALNVPVSVEASR